MGSSNCLASDHEEERYAYACMSENFVGESSLFYVCLYIMIFSPSVFIY